MIAVTRNGLQILILRISVSPSDLLTSLSYLNILLSTRNLLVNGSATLPCSISSRKASRRSFPLPADNQRSALWRTGGSVTQPSTALAAFLCLNTPGVFLCPQPDHYLRPEWSGFPASVFGSAPSPSVNCGSDSRHDPSFSQQTDGGKHRGKTLGDNHLFRCFSEVYRSGQWMRQIAGYRAADFYPRQDW